MLFFDGKLRVFIAFVSHCKLIFTTEFTEKKHRDTRSFILCETLCNLLLSLWLHDRTARAAGNAQIVPTPDIRITIKFKIALLNPKIKSYFCSVKKEVSYFISATLKGACHPELSRRANQPINHSIFLTNDLLHPTTGGIITG